MASYERIVCMTCKDTCDLGCKRAGKTVKMLLSNIDKLIAVERLISEINEGFGAYEGIKGLELTAYCEGGSDVPVFWLSEHNWHDLRDFDDLKVEEMDEVWSWRKER